MANMGPAMTFIHGDHRRYTEADASWKRPEKTYCCSEMQKGSTFLKQDFSLSATAILFTRVLPNADVDQAFPYQVLATPSDHLA